MQKKVDKREKYYAKLEKQLERQANYYKNSANTYFSNMMGMGANSVNLANPYGSNGAIQQILSGLGADQMNQMLGLDGKAHGGYKISPEVAKAIANGTLQVNGSQKDMEWQGKTIPAGALYDAYTGKVFDDKNAQAAGQAYQQLQQMAQMQVSQMSQYATQMKTNYEQNVSIWLEAQQEQLEAQKEWEMDMLEEEQADMEAEKNSVDAQLEIIKNEKQNIEQALGQAIQDSAPKFGLA